MWGNGVVTSRILKLAAAWRLVVSFTPCPFYLRVRIPGYPVDKRLGGPQKRLNAVTEGRISGVSEKRPASRQSVCKPD